MAVPDDLDPAEVVSLVFPYMTAYQLLHRTARAKPGESVLVHGAAGRVGTAILELGALAGLRLYGTAAGRDRAVVERLGAVAIDYQNEDFLARVRGLTGDGVDIALDGIGGPLSLRSFRALRPGGRLVVFGRYATIAQGRKNWPGVFAWYAATGERRPLGFAFAAPEGAVLPHPEVAHPPPGLVPGGLSRACSRCSAAARFTRWWPSACRFPRLVAPMSCWGALRLQARLCLCPESARSRQTGRVASFSRARSAAVSCRAGRIAATAPPATRTTSADSHVEHGRRPVRVQQGAGDERGDDGADAADSDRPADAGAPDGRAVERGGDGVHAGNAAVDRACPRPRLQRTPRPGCRRWK